MSYEVLSPEVVRTGLEILAFALPTLAMALSQRQREAIKERDGEHCQFPARHKCNGWGMNKKLHVHHIVGQMYSEIALGQTEEQYDVPENVLTICTNSHFQKIHTDQTELNGGSYANGEFARVQEHRKELAQSGVKYWNTLYDHELIQRAKELTSKAVRKGWSFPPVNHRNGNGHS